MMSPEYLSNTQKTMRDKKGCFDQQYLVSGLYNVIDYLCKPEPKVGVNRRRIYS